MSAGSMKQLPDKDIAPLNFIYACSVCCASFADVYEGHTESVRGLSDGINPKERLVSKLYLASCCHVFCSSHLENGGPPFHPAGQRPKAPCPVCIKEKSDCESRDLYSVRGFIKGEYDPQIPPSWFTTPPIRLDGNGKEMEALRFQYIALIRYCQNTYTARKPTQDALAEAEKNIARLQKSVSDEHKKVLSLEQENTSLLATRTHLNDLQVELQRLQGLESEFDRYRRLNVNPRDLETFVANKSAIRHYLKLVPVLLEQNERMKERLASIGLAMALQPGRNLEELHPHAFDNEETFLEESAPYGETLLRQTTSSHTVGRSAHASCKATTAPSSPLHPRPLKRRRQESPQLGDMDIVLPDSRDAMPPPSKPISRMQSMRKIIPKIRKKFSHTRPTSSMDKARNGIGDTSKYQRDDWQTSSTRHTPVSDQYQEVPPYMSGASSVEKYHGGGKSYDRQLHSSTEIRDAGSEFTFQAQSPVSQSRRASGYQPIKLPTEPSYIRLMDGLSHERDMELELNDPRQEDVGKMHDEQTVVRNREVSSGRQLHEVQKRKTRRKPGHAFLRHLPSMSPSMSHSQTGPKQTSSGADYQQLSNSPVTPGPRRSEQTHHQAESVVSPYFNASHRQTQLQSRTGTAEPQASSTPSGVFQYHRPKMDGARRIWRDPPSLNGLSFFDSPVNSRNKVILEPLKRSTEDRYPNTKPMSHRNLNSRGFMTRPDERRSPLVEHGTHGSPHPQSNNDRYAHIFAHSAIPSPSVGPAYSRPLRNPSTRLPITSRPSSVRTSPQWEPLQRAGVRSSRQTLDRVVEHNYPRSSRDSMLDHGRRTVRR